MSAHLLTTKLYIPPPHPNTVLRTRLIERLNEGIHHKLTLISAPAGFGKTTLVSEWVAALPLHISPSGRGQEVKAAWVSLDEADKDPKRFLAYLIAALQTVDANIGVGIIGILQSPQPPATEPLLTILLNEIASISSPLILVLDDYHVIDTKSVDDILIFLLDHLPPQMHVVVATREDPFIPLARLRARGQLTELRAADLRFSLTEATEFLNKAMDLNLSVEDIAVLETQTEGWIAGLQLAAHALQGIIQQGQGDPTRFIQSFSGNHRFVLDYLIEEVLQRQPKHIRGFLLRTAILERLNASLCETVTEFKESQSILETLERSNLFVIPLDNQRQWYRYHHLFAEVLQAHLAERWPDEVPVLHRRASAWYEQNDLSAEAIHHALSAEDWERAAGLIELAHPAMDISYQSAIWLTWAKALPEELVRSRPVLCVAVAWALLDGGEMEACEVHLQNAERWLNADGNLPKVELRGFVVDETQYRSMPASIATARAYRSLALGDVPGAVKNAQRALTITPADDPIRHLQAVSLLAVAQYTNGDLEAAECVLADLQANFRKRGEIMALLGITYLLANIRVALGHLHEAEYTYQQALQQITNLGEPPIVGTSDLYRGLGELACERGNLEIAAGYFDTGEKLGEQAALTDWQHRLCVAQARLKEIQGDLDGALALLGEAERVYVRAPLPDVRPISALRARIWIRQGRLQEALAWASEQKLSRDDDLSYLREFEHITLTRILIAQYQRDRIADSIHEAMELLSRLLQAAEAGSRLGSMIEILIVQALALQAQGNISGASATLARALSIAEPQGYVQIFIDEGLPMEMLLRETAQHGSGSEYLHQLLAACKKSESQIIPGTHAMIEPLSERELVVLKLLESELSGPEIASELMVSLNTMRTHTKNIYRKLGVNSRRSAVRCAKQLDLL